MSMNLNIQMMELLVSKLTQLEGLDIEVTQIQHEGHVVFLRQEKGNLVVIGISDKIPAKPVMRSADQPEVVERYRVR